jgi:hypothetical protein
VSRAKATAQRLARRLGVRAGEPAGDRTPPHPPPGWRAAPPDFVGVGVQRAGTSWWFDELASHPDVHRLADAPKELHFFGTFSDRRLTDDDIARYHGWFPRPDGGRTGEWTPSYLYEPWSVPLLVRAAPDARLLVMLRDPVDRFRSSLLFTLRRNVPHAQAVVDAYHRGLYAPQIARLLAHARSDRVLVLVYEQARAEPDATRRRTAEFLSLDPGRFPAPPNVERPHDRRARIERELPPELLAELQDRYRDDIAQLASLLPDLDLGRWPTASSSR